MFAVLLQVSPSLILVSTMVDDGMQRMMQDYSEWTDTQQIG